MYYKIIEKFGPEDGDKWRGYLQWRGLDLEKFDSVDSGLRPDRFEPVSNEDWQNCVLEDFKINLITNLGYAKKIIDQYDNSVLIGVDIEIDEGYQPNENLLGFDIIDVSCGVSLVTNWGTDEEGLFVNDVMPNGLIGSLLRALQIRDTLRKGFSEDSHAENCEVWAIYGVNT